MRNINLIFFTLIVIVIPLRMLSQSNANISVVSVEKLNILYRGVPNTIKVAFQGADSIVVSAGGLRKGTGVNEYLITPGQGNATTIDITAIMPDGSRKFEKKIFRIKGLPL